MLVTRAEPLPIECVARGYLSGSGWKDYQATGEVCGIALPAGLRESDRLPQPIFTPATKAQSGHDINITADEASRLVDPAVLERARAITLRLYDGRAPADRLILIDEVLTPDSSRFWPADRYHAGGPQPSFDKQFVRDYCESLGWDKTYPGPALPDDVVAGTRARYVEAFERLTGIAFDDYLARPE